MSPYTSIATATQQGLVVGTGVAVPPTAVLATMIVTMATADIETAGITVIPYIYQSSDNVNFVAPTYGDWQSGPDQIFDGQPTPAGVTAGLSNPPPAYMQAAANFSVPVSAGAVIYFYDANNNLL